MSSSRAQTVAEYFPTFVRLADHYTAAATSGEDITGLLSKTIPQITKPISERMCKFFVK